MLNKKIMERKWKTKRESEKRELEGGMEKVVAVKNINHMLIC